MAAASITVDLLRGSVPAACYLEGGKISAAIVLIEGLTVLPLEIETITVGTGDTDEVTLTYDDDLIPEGIELLACHLSSFQCVCDCCPERTCYEVVAPTEEVTASTTYLVGFNPAEILIDQIKFYSPSPSVDPIEVTLAADGVAILSVVSVENESVFNRAQFEAAFADGLIDADARLTLDVVAVPSAWSGLVVCFLGFRQSIFAP